MNCRSSESWLVILLECEVVGGSRELLRGLFSRISLFTRDCPDPVSHHLLVLRGVDEAFHRPLEDSAAGCKPSAAVWRWLLSPSAPVLWALLCIRASAFAMLPFAL